MISRRADNLVLFIAIFSSLIYLNASGDVVVMVSVIAAMFGARALTGRVGSGKSLPGEVISLAVVGVLGVILATALATGFDIELFSRLIALLMTLKAFERRRARDLTQMLMLSVFLFIGALLSDSGLVVGFGLLVMTPLVAAGAMLLQLMIASESAQVNKPELSAEWRRSFRRTVALISVLGLTGSLMIFLVIPRGFADRAFGNWGEVSLGNSTVGFDDEIDLDLGGLISGSQVPVLDLQVLDRDGNQLGEDGKHFYLRGAVLDVYEDHKWKSGVSDRNINMNQQFMAGVEYNFSTASRSNPRDWSYTQHVILRNAQPNRSYIFGSWEPLGFSFDQTTSIQVRPELGVARLQSSGGKLSYTLRVRDALAKGDQNSRVLASGRGFPASFGVEAVRAYSVALLEEAEIAADPAERTIRDDRRVARVFENHLRQQFTYTLSPESPPKNTDPIEWFLLQQRRGHCEFFASAMTAMCRSVGIHARVVTGYIAIEFNELTGFYVVRESNAHAWVEIQVIPERPSRLPGSNPGRWETFDPTPPSDLREIHDPSDTLLAKVRKLFETAEFAWINSVVGFGAESQSSMVGSLQMPAFLQNLGSKTENRIQDGGQRLILIALAIGVSAFAACLFSLTILRRLWLVFAGGLTLKGFTRSRTRAPKMARSGHESAYRSLLRSLRKRGSPKPIGIPLRRHLESLGDELAEIPKRAFMHATDLLYLAEFGKEGLSDDQHSALRQAVREATARSG